MFLCSVGMLLTFESDARIEEIKMRRVIDIGIGSQERDMSIELLNGVLAGEFVLLVQTLNYHWNLEGPEFRDYHLLFDDHYKTLFEKIDEIAERVRAVDGRALGSMDAIIRSSTLQEDRGAVPHPKKMIENLLEQHEALIRQIRIAVNKTAENNNDMGTSNFLTELLEKHEKIAWMLRSLAQK